MKVEEIMTPSPVTVDIRSTVADAVDKLLEFNLSSVLVVSGAQYVGVITDKELRPFSFPVSEDSDALKGYRKHLNAKISDVFRSDLPVAWPDMELVEVLDLMIESGAGLLPVVDHQAETLCGVVTLWDVLKAARTVFDD